MKPQYVKHKDQKMMQIHTAMKQADMSLISPSRDFKGGEKSAHTCLNLPKISVLRIFLNVDSRSVLLQKNNARPSTSASQKSQLHSTHTDGLAAAQRRLVHHHKVPPFTVKKHLLPGSHWLRGNTVLEYGI